MFSKLTQPKLKNFSLNYSPYDAKSVICGGSKNPCRSKVMAFSNKRVLFLFSWEREFSMGSSVTECPWATNATWRVLDNLLWVNAFTNDIFAGVMVSNTVNGL